MRRAEPGGLFAPDRNAHYLAVLARAAKTEPRMSGDPKVSDPDRSRPSNREKDPDDWTTGDEPMTGAQASYLKTLCEEAGEAFAPDLSKAEASKRIDALRAKTGRGR
jgi:Protein of unknown function (DUF3072)